MSSLEYSEWLAYHAIDPIGPERADAAAGLIASVIANVNRDPKKKASAFTAADFMLRYDQSPPERDPDAHWQAQKSAFKALAKKKK